MQKKPVVAIVDDDESACEGTTDLLKAMGFVAKGSRSAEDFLQSSHLRHTACVITDMRMSGMTGLELHDHLVQSGKTIPTILVTASPNDRDRARAPGRRRLLPGQTVQRPRFAAVRPFSSRISQGGKPVGENDE